MQPSKKILIYKIACALFAAALLLMPHPGFTRSDIRLLATVVGVDFSSGGFTVSAQLSVPVSQSGDGEASTVAVSKGGSMAEALENLETEMGRRIDYGHLSTVAFGNDINLNSLKDCLDYLLSSGISGPGAYLVYCDGSSASDFLAEAQKMGSGTEAEISSFITYSKSGNHVTTTTALRFLQTLNSTSGAAVMPCVSIENAGEENKSEGDSGNGEQEGGEQKASGGEQKSGAKKLKSAEKLAVFCGDKQGATVLGEYVTSGFVWQDKNSEFGLVELKNVMIDGENVSSVPARLSGKKVKRKVSTENGDGVLEYKIKVKLKLDDSRICGNPVFFGKWKNALTKEFESVIQNSLYYAVETSKSLDCDFLGLREQFHKFCRRGYESFDLNKVIVRVKASVEIIS